MNREKWQLLRGLMEDSYSVELFSAVLLDRQGASKIRAHYARLYEHLYGWEMEPFENDLMELRRMMDAYAGDGRFDQRDLPVIGALELFITQSEAILSETVLWIPSREGVAE